MLFYWNSWSLTLPLWVSPEEEIQSGVQPWERTLGFTQLFPPLLHLSGLDHPSRSHANGTSSLSLTIESTSFPLSLF